MTLTIRPWSLPLPAANFSFVPRFGFTLTDQGLAQVVAAWNGMSISAFATASRVLASDASPTKPSSFPADRQEPSVYMDAAVKVDAVRASSLHHEFGEASLRAAAFSPQHAAHP